MEQGGWKREKVLGDGVRFVSGGVLRAIGGGRRDDKEQRGSGEAEKREKGREER